MTRTKKLIERTSIGLLLMSCLVLGGQTGVQRKRPEVPYVPTPPEVVAKMLRMAAVGPDDVLFDLGCGDGRIVITAAKELGCRGVGIDIDINRIKDSRANASEAGVSERVEFLHMDLFDADIRPATVVTLYLLSSVNRRLRPKLFQDLKPGTRVVSHDFSMGEWEPEEVLDIKDKVEYVPFQDTRDVEDYWNDHTVYFWVIPANVSGVWEWSLPSLSGNKTYKLEVEQNFQKLKGQAFEGTKPIPFHPKNGKIIGDKLEFTLERQAGGRTEKWLFEGMVRGQEMIGFVRIEGNPDFEEKWQARRDPSTRRSIAN